MVKPEKLWINTEVHSSAEEEEEEDLFTEVAVCIFRYVYC